MGYCEIRITADHFELRDDSGRSVATVKGMRNAKLFAKSWEYEKKLEDLIPVLRDKGEDDLAESVIKLLKEEPKEVRNASRNRRGN